MQPYLSGVTLNTFVIQNLTSRYVNLTAGTTAIKVGETFLFGATVNSHSSGTIKIWDDTSTTAPATVAFNLITLGATERDLNFRGVRLGTGAVVVIGGTANVTFAFA